MEEGVCDRYIFTDTARVRENLMELLDIENGENDILVYQNVAAALSALGWREKAGEGAEDGSGAGGSWIGAGRTYGMGALEGTTTGAYRAKYIGASSRERYRGEKIRELEKTLGGLEEEAVCLGRELELIRKRAEMLGEEWDSFPPDQDVRVAAREYERQEERLRELNEKLRRQREETETEREALDQIRRQAQEACRKCYLSPRLDLFEKVTESLKEYQELLAGLQVEHGKYVNGVSSANLQKEYLEDIDRDLDDIRYELGRILNRQKTAKSALGSVLEQLKLTDYEKIRERLDFCLERLASIPGEKETAVGKRSGLDREYESLLDMRRENQAEEGRAEEKRERLALAFEREYRLGYVICDFAEKENPEEAAGKVCGMLAGRFGNKKQSDYLGSLQEAYHRNRGYLLEYQITLQTLF